MAANERASKETDCSTTELFISKSKFLSGLQCYSLLRHAYNWIISGKMKYGEREFAMPILVRMKFTGDVAIVTVYNLAISGSGTYTARLLIYERTYSGTWKGQRGGMLYGTIANKAE